VASDAGALVGTIALDPRGRRGVVSLTHGWADPNVDHLVSATDDVDPLTGQPVMTGIPVTVTAIAE